MPDAAFRGAYCQHSSLALHIVQIIVLALDMANLNPKTIFVLSALDKLISEHKANPATFMPIFEQKESIINLLQDGKIDANKYKKIIANAYKEESGIVKACAEEDMQKIKNAKDPKQVEAWFKLMIQTTGTNYQKQQKLYKHYQAQISPPTNVVPNAPQKPQPPQSNPQPPPNAPAQSIAQKSVVSPQKPQEYDPEKVEIVSFKYLDDLMDEQEKPERYQRWYDSKKKLWDLLVKKELTAQKYKANLQLSCKRLKGTQIENDYQFQLYGIEEFHNGNVAEWFKEIIEQTKDNFQSQTQKLNKLLKGGQPKKQEVAQKKPSPPQPARQSTSLQATKQKQPIASFDIAQINSFKVFDQVLEQQCDNKNNYREVLEKKKKFMQLAKRGELNAEKYKRLLLKSIAQAKNPLYKESMGWELSQLSEFHDNNLSQWFKDIISNAQLQLQVQQQGLKQLQQGKKLAKKKNESEDEIDMKFLNGQDEDVDLPDDDDQLIQVKPEPTKPALKKEVASSAVKKEPLTQKQSGSNEYSEFFSLKALDQIMSENQGNAQIFCQCFERKQAIFGMMQKGQIDAEKYKVLQQKSIKSSNNAKLKECVEMDLFDLKDMCSGNVNEWFQSLINEAGFNFEEQQEKYQKLKSKGAQIPKEQPQTQKEEVAVQKGQEIKQKPIMIQVISFTAVARLFESCLRTSDIVYYKQLCAKRQKLIQVVNLGKLIPSKYKEINKAAFVKTDNEFLKSTIQEELQALASKFKDNEQAWFQSLKKQLLQQPPELKLPENPLMKKINGLPAEQKAQYLAKRMAPYQSLVAYYTAHKLSPKENPHIQTYLKKKKKEAFQAIVLISKDKQFDVFNFAQQVFPPIDSEIFYAGNLPALKKKAESLSAAFAQEIAALKDYSTKIKKATNPQNLENTRKEIAQCQENIASLKNWPGKQLVPFPIVTQEKVERYNLDLNTHLDNNEVEVNITYIEGLKGQFYLKIYAGQSQNERFWVKVKNGPQGAVKTIIKLPAKEMADLMKGDRPVITIKIFDKNFFGSWKLLQECTLSGSFGRNNVVEEKAVAGEIRLHYQMRVYKPTKPLVTEIQHATLKLLPPFELDGAVMKQLTKECVSRLTE